MTDEPIRVLFVVPDLRFGGAERHVATLVPRMDRTRFTASVVCIGQEGDLFGDVVQAGLEAKALQLGGMRGAIRALPALVEHMRRSRPDIVVVWGYNAEILGRVAALIAGVKCSVVWVHAATVDDGQRSSMRRLVARMLIRFTSSYFGVAESQRTFITKVLRCPEGKVRIVYNGVDPVLFEMEDDRSPLAQFGIDADDPVVGIVAALRPEKDHATLLRAVSSLVTRVPRTRVLIVGDGPTRAALEALCEELGIGDNVRFAGSRSDIARLLRAMDVFVLCSTTECFPLSVLEAMACARPVVCTDVGGVGEMVNDGVSGYLVPARDHQRMATRLEELLSDPGLAHRMGQAGLHRVRSDFTLRQSVEGAERAIAAVVSGGRRRRH